MLTRENQKVITIVKDKEDGLYAQLNIDAAEEAMKLLKPSTFKVWFYLAKNKNNYKLSLSRVEIMRFCNILSKNTYFLSIKELIEKRFLIKEEGKENYYKFYERCKN